MTSLRSEHIVINVLPHMPPAYVEIIPTKSVNDNKQATRGAKGSSQLPLFFLIKRVTFMCPVHSHSTNPILSAAILASLERMPAEQFKTRALDAIFPPSQHFTCM